ncbi:sugar ABC transporter substrate-binding protein [Actinoplanes lobatus]|uniref:Putative aldouronate transport system substrate-binding protein n=1 Tax=Actinoplanes lobatus TaxID=113568 RepID=A0A7W7HE44_9ACTN|nr:extracellular solute-binding protein [Actinoplanes lobatus]MBB4748855.1 putative aldouronate transport system substrate-binding protein [Actinoplanes lobatus]GGN67723.1 sugar ABC transporter substrate-binding protein [Actinoplanes lobatus]GIE37237.1 sugar ABC transporter substrate-binding protein [Actinoplanes lobatus]
MANTLPGASTNRRNFLGLVGLGAASLASGGVLAGCSKEPGVDGSATTAEEAAGVIPKFKDSTLVQPDIKGVRPMADGYAKYPTSLADAVTDKAVGSGKPVTATTPWWGPAPPTANKLVEAVNADMGAVINFSIQDGNTYGDKLSAMLGARDVPELTCIPGWETNKLARFSEGVHALFEDLTPYLAGDKVNAYPLLAGLDSVAWQESVWGGKLMAVPFPVDAPYPTVLFYRKDVADERGIAAPTTLDELWDFGKKLTNEAKGEWAFGDIWWEVQQICGVGGSENGWIKQADGKVVNKMELPEYKRALEFMTKVYAEKLIHPDLASSKGGDVTTLFKGGKIFMYATGGGSWKETWRPAVQTNPKFNMQAVKVFGADKGQAPVRLKARSAIIWTFIKKDLGQERVQELLRVLNYTAAPFGTKEWELQNYGVEGTHFTRDASGTPVTNDLYVKEFANQYVFLGGRPPVVVGGPDIPTYAGDFVAWGNDATQYLEKNPWEGIKVETPSEQAALAQPTEDKITDIQRGRTPISEFDKILSDWKAAGGDKARDFYAKVLADNGR